jgi:hypothetical protein
MVSVLFGALLYTSLATLGASFNASFQGYHSVKRGSSLSAKESMHGSDGVLNTRRSFGLSISVATVLTFSGKASAVIDKFQSDQKRESASFGQTYLTEPTDEFKRNEEKAVEFKRAQLKIKQNFIDVLTRFTNESTTEAEIVKDLQELRELVIVTGGLPIGIKKEQIYKTVRAKKRLSWSTPSEIAYQDLIREISYQQSPNTDKDLSNYQIG